MMMMHEGATTAATTNPTANSTQQSNTNTNNVNNLNNLQAGVGAASSSSSSLIQLLNNQHQQLQTQQQQQQQQQQASLPNVSSASSFIHTMIQQESSLNFGIKLNKDNSFTEHQQRKLEMLESRFAPVNTQKIEFSKVRKPIHLETFMKCKASMKVQDLQFSKRSLSFFFLFVSLLFNRAYRKTSQIKAWPLMNKKTTYNSR